MIGIVGAVCAIWTCIALALASRFLSVGLALPIGIAASLGVALIYGRHLSRMLDGVVLRVGHLAEEAGPRKAANGRASLREIAAIHRGLLVAHDLLERRGAAAREALLEACTGHDLLASVVRGTADIIYVKDTDLSLVLANAAACARGPRRWEAWELIGRRAVDFLPPSIAAAEEMIERKVLATGETRVGVVDWPSADGTIRHVALTRSAWRDIEGAMSGVVVVGRDVTDERAGERRLAKAQAHLLRATRLSAMGAMATGLAHELNQPLAAATNFIAVTGRMLDGGVASARGAARASLDDAGAQIRRASDIVRRLVAFVARGEPELLLEDACGVVREACEVALADGFNGAASLEVVLDAEPCMALLDRTQMQQVLLNLIRNAAEAFVPPTVGVVRVSCRAGPDSVEIAVTDDGPGLAPELGERLFLPFVSTKPDGMGIGLAICRTIVEGHGGVLSAGAAPGGGTVFRIRVPQAGWWDRGAPVKEEP